MDFTKMIRHGPPGSARSLRAHCCTFDGEVKARIRPKRLPKVSRKCRLNTLLSPAAGSGINPRPEKSGAGG